MALLIFSSVLGCNSSIPQETNANNIEKRIKKIIANSLKLSEPRYGLFEESIALLNQVSELAPDKLFLVKFNLGLIYLKSNKIDQAISNYQEAIELNPGFGTAHFHLGNALFKKQFFEKAVGHYQAAARIFNRKIKQPSAPKKFNETQEENMITHRASSYSQIGLAGDFMKSKKTAIVYTLKARVAYSKIIDPNGYFTLQVNTIDKRLNNMIKKYGFSSLYEATNLYKTELISSAKIN
jgi:tetratricopeptide (TPR) repeat protein